MIEMTDLMHAHDSRNPHYTARKHGFFAECAICGELVHRENDSYTYIGEDDYDTFYRHCSGVVIGYAHDECLDRLEDSL